MADKIPKEEIKKISFIDHENIHGRAVPSICCFVNDEWEYWVPGQDGLVKLKDPIPVEAMYFSKDQRDDNDIFLNFFNLIVKNAYFPEIVHFQQSILDDLYNLSASLNKLDLLFNVWEIDNEKVSRHFVSTELEFIFNTSRSIFDLLQKLIKKLWKRINYGLW